MRPCSRPEAAQLQPGPGPGPAAAGPWPRVLTRTHGQKAPGLLLCFTSSSTENTPPLSSFHLFPEIPLSVQIMTSNSLRASGIREVPGRCKHNLENYKEEDSLGPHLRRHHASFSSGPGSRDSESQKGSAPGSLRRVLGPAGAWAWGHGSAIPPPPKACLLHSTQPACRARLQPPSSRQASQLLSLAPSLDPKQPDCLLNLGYCEAHSLPPPPPRPELPPEMGQTLIMISKEYV